MLRLTPLRRPPHPCALLGLPAARAGAALPSITLHAALEFCWAGTFCSDYLTAQIEASPDSHPTWRRRGRPAGCACAAGAAVRRRGCAFQQLSADRGVYPHGSSTSIAPLLAAALGLDCSLQPAGICRRPQRYHRWRCRASACFRLFSALLTHLPSRNAFFPLSQAHNPRKFPCGCPHPSGTPPNGPVPAFQHLQSAQLNTCALVTPCSATPTRPARPSVPPPLHATVCTLKEPPPTPISLL